jgi:hypothetical protein
MNTEDLISVVVMIVIGVAVYTVAHVWLHLI